MAGKEFNVLYTHQKRKKAKVWQDGILKVNDQGTKATLLGEGNKRLDQVHLKVNQVAVGEELESEKYLITIEEAVLSSDKPLIPEAISHEKCQQNPPDNRPDSQSLRRLPLKRKRTGFVPPRQINKNPSPEKESSHNAKEIPQLSTSSEFGTSRSSLFSTPCNNISLQQGPNILNMYERNTVNTSQSNATSSQLQHGMRNSTGSNPHQQGNDQGSEFQLWDDDRTQLSMVHAAPHDRQLVHSQTGTLMDVGAGQQQGHQLVKNTDIRSTYNNEEDGRELTKTNEFGPNKSSLSANLPSVYQKLPLRRSSEHVGYKKHPALFANAVKAETNADAMENNLSENLWRLSSGQDSCKDHSDRLASSVNTRTNTAALETRLTKDVLDQSDNAPGAKRSTSRILALLGKGRKPFQPPLKTKTTQDTDSVSQTSIGQMGDPSSQAILRPHRQEHVHQNNDQTSVTSSELMMAKEQTFDEPPSFNTESQKPDMYREFDTDLSGKTTSLISTSKHQSIPSENDLTISNNRSDQVNAGSPREGTACPETRFYQENPATKQNQDMRLGVNKRTGLGTDRKVSKNHEVDQSSEMKKDQCKECQGSRCACKLSNSYHEENLILNVTSCDSNRKMLYRVKADPEVVAACSLLESVDEHLIVQGKEDKDNSQIHAIFRMNDSEGLGIAPTCKSDSNPNMLHEEEELNTVSDIDIQDIKSSTSENSPHFMETKIRHNEPDVPQHSDSNCAASYEENHEKHTSLNLSQNEQASLHAQNKQRSLTDDASEEPHFTSPWMGTSLQIDIVPVDTSCLQDSFENKADVFQSSPDPEIQSDVGDENDDKLQRNDAQQAVHPFDDMDTDYEQVSFNSTTDADQKTTTLAADSDLHVDNDGGKIVRDDNSTLGPDAASLTLSSKEDGDKNRIDVCQKSPRLEVRSDVDNRENDADHGIDTDGRTPVSSCDYITPKDTSAVVQKPLCQETDSDPIDCEEDYMSKDAQLNTNAVDISHDTICEHDSSKGTIDVFQISSSLEGDSDSICGKENLWNKDDQFCKSHIDISSETTCEHGSLKGTKDVRVLQNSQSIEAGSLDHGVSLLRDKAQNSIHPGNVGLHRYDSKLSGKLQEFQMEEHIRKLEMAHHEASSCPTSHDAEPMLPDGSSQQSCGTSIDTLDFSQDTQQNKETTLYLQDIQRGHIQRESTDHSPVPTYTQNVDALVPDVDCIKTQNLPESQVGGSCDITKHFSSKKSPSFCGPTVAELKRSEQSVPEISCSRRHDETVLSKPGEPVEVHTGRENVPEDDYSTPGLMVELSAPASEWFRKEVDEDCDDNPSMYMSWPVKENHQQIGTTRKDQSNRDMAIYDNCNEAFKIPSSTQAEGSTPLRQLPDGYDLKESTRCVWNATPENSRRLSQLVSSASMSSLGSEQDILSPVFEMPQPEELHSYTQTQNVTDQNNMRYQDKHSSILPHPSYLKTSVRRKATNRSDSDMDWEVEGDSPKEGIYWKQYVSSGKVRRQTKTATQSTFKPRQDLDSFQETSSDASRGHLYDTPIGRIDRPASPFDNFVTPSQAGFQVNPDWGSNQGMVPSEASRIQPYDTPVQRSSRLALPFENSIRTYPQNPFQTEFQRSNDRSTPLQTSLLNADGSSASGMSRSETPSGNLFSLAPNSSDDPSEEHCKALPRTTLRQGHFSKSSIGNVRRKHWLPALSRNYCLEDEPSCDATSMQGLDTRMNPTISNVVFDTCDSQAGLNSNPFPVDARLQDFFPMSQSNEYRSCSPTLPRCQSPCDFFGVNDIQSYFYQANGSCRDQLSQSPTTRSQLSVREPADVSLPEPDIMSLYSTQSTKPCRDAVLVREKYNGCYSYQRDSFCDMYNLQGHGEDAMNTGQFGNQSHGCDVAGTDEQDLVVSQSVSNRPPSISGINMYDTVEASNGHHGWFDETNSSPHNSVYGDSSNAEVLSTRSPFKMLSDDGIHIDSHSQPFLSCDQITNSVVCSNIIEQSEFEVNVERTQTPDLFTTQQDDSVNDGNSPKSTPKGHTLQEYISLSPGPLSMVRPGIVTDALDNDGRQDGSKAVRSYDVGVDQCGYFHEIGPQCVTYTSNSRFTY